MVGIERDEPQREDPSMTETLIELARRIENQRWNRPGTDKTWALDVMSSYWRLQEEIRQAKRVEPHEPTED